MYDITNLPILNGPREFDAGSEKEKLPTQSFVHTDTDYKWRWSASSASRFIHSLTYVRVYYSIFNRTKIIFFPKYFVLVYDICECVKAGRGQNEPWSVGRPFLYFSSFSVFLYRYMFFGFPKGNCVVSFLSFFQGRVLCARRKKMVWAPTFHAMDTTMWRWFSTTLLASRFVENCE